MLNITGERGIAGTRLAYVAITGKQRLVDTAGRVERFRRKYAKAGDAKAAK